MCSSQAPGLAVPSRLLQTLNPNGQMLPEQGRTSKGSYCTERRAAFRGLSASLSHSAWPWRLHHRKPPAFCKLLSGQGVRECGAEEGGNQDQSRRRQRIETGAGTGGRWHMERPKEESGPEN